MIIHHCLHSLIKILTEFNIRLYVKSVKQIIPMDNPILKYNGFVPPCGIYCGGCAVFVRDKNRCHGAEIGCRTRKCKGIYFCCMEKKGLEFCSQCKSYPCSRFKKFADRWTNYGQDLLKNQEIIKNIGKDGFIIEMNKTHGNTK